MLGTLRGSWVAPPAAITSTAARRARRARGPSAPESPATVRGVRPSGTSEVGVDAGGISTPSPRRNARVIAARPGGMHNQNPRSSPRAWASSCSRCHASCASACVAASMGAIESRSCPRFLFFPTRLRGSGTPARTGPTDGFLLGSPRLAIPVLPHGENRPDRAYCVDGVDARPVPTDQAPGPPHPPPLLRPTGEA